MEHAKFLQFEDQRRDQRLQRTALTFARRAPRRRRAIAMTASRRLVIRAAKAAHRVGHRSKRTHAPDFMRDDILPGRGARLNPQGSLRRPNCYREIINELRMAGMTADSVRRAQIKGPSDSRAIRHLCPVRRSACTPNMPSVQDCSDDQPVPRASAWKESSVYL